jgi:hypothetical protein
MNTPKTAIEQTEAAAKFAADWAGKGYEKGETQPFWLDLLRMLGVDDPAGFIRFERKATEGSAHGFIDGYIKSTRVLVEQKSLGKDLRKALPQSDGALLTPYEQARRYAARMPLSEHPRWIVLCNFEEFLVYDQEKPDAPPESIRLADLPAEFTRLRFLVDAHHDRVAREMEVSFRAGAIVGKIYDALLPQYADHTPETLRELNVLCVRLVFCLYAEDTAIFRYDQFHDYLAKYDAGDTRRALLDLFAVLDTPPEKRSPYLSDDLAAFPYVNGGLFSKKADIPRFTPELRETLLERASLGFDWADISPTIFGALFESTLNPETRRSGGMHYTSIENIHKVIDPLFLDGLTAELDALLAAPATRARAAKLRAFQERLAALSFLDPACGSGNFLTETYLSLRRLENRALKGILGDQPVFDLDGSFVKVSISQFHGIEINDFAVAVAKTALWIAETQMLTETARLVQAPNVECLPLKSYDGIREGNAHRMDWAVGARASSPRSRGQDARAPAFDYIMGNPPFVGARLMSPDQKADLAAVFGEDWPNLGNLDYVSGWFKKAAEYMGDCPDTHAALVATNSICQGETPANLWQPLFDDEFDTAVGIDFAHRTFRWDSESSSKAHVHCVIIGFSRDRSRDPKPLFDGGKRTLVPHINAYLVNAPDYFVESRNEPISAPLPLVFGSMPNDGGHLSDWSPERRAKALARWPKAEPLFRRITGSQEYINGIERWCLWLKDASPALIRAVPPVMEAVEAVHAKRLASKRDATRRLADTPTLFGEIRQPERGNYLIVPSVSSEKRRYVPMGFLSSDVIANNLALIVPGATLYHFGVLTSNVHMAWMRTVAGRLKSDYRYSAQIVYNNFPWPQPTKEQEARISETAQGILDARAKHSDSTLADLYDAKAMPKDLRDAHRENDKAVMAAYGFPVSISETDCVAALFRLCNHEGETPAKLWKSGIVGVGVPVDRATREAMYLLPEYYRAIECGDKDVEFRDRTDFYDARLGGERGKALKSVRFRCRAFPDEEMTWEIESITCDEVDGYAIALGKRLQ